MPWLIAAAAFVQNRRRLRRLPVLSSVSSARAASFPLPLRIPPSRAKTRLKHILLTPTYWIAALAFAGIIPLAVLVRGEILHEENLHNRIWPAERAVTLARVQSRQTATPTPSPESRLICNLT